MTTLEKRTKPFFIIKPPKNTADNTCPLDLHRFRKRKGGVFSTPFQYHWIVNSFFFPVCHVTSFAISLLDSSHDANDHALESLCSALGLLTVDTHNSLQPVLLVCSSERTILFSM